MYRPFDPCLRIVVDKSTLRTIAVHPCVSASQIFGKRHNFISTHRCTGIQVKIEGISAPASILNGLSLSIIKITSAY